VRIDGACCADDAPILSGVHFAFEHWRIGRLRFFAAIRECPTTAIGELTRLDYARAMAFIAIDEASDLMLVSCGLHLDADHQKNDKIVTRAASTAVIVRSSAQGPRPRLAPMQRMDGYARTLG